MTPHDPPTNDDDGYGLVMPFVSVASRGGPHDDDSYVAGYECGQWSERMRAYACFGLGPAKAVMPVRTENVPQLDLLAMRWGLALIIEPVEGMPDWTWITLAPRSAS
jgi:hypothetical protein